MFIMLCSFLVFVILILNANLSAPCIEMLCCGARFGYLRSLIIRVNVTLRKFSLRAYWNAALVIFIQFRDFMLLVRSCDAHNCVSLWELYTLRRVQPEQMDIFACCNIFAAIATCLVA